jgi:hypothetical protein
MRRTILLLAALLFPMLVSANTLVTKCSEDYYLGDATYSLSVDGVVVATNKPCTAHGGRLATVQQSDTYTGNWPTNVAHKVMISLTNHIYAGSPTTTRNLYIWSVTLDGAVAAGTTTLISAGTNWIGYLNPPGIWEYANNGSLTWTTQIVTPPPVVTTPPTLTVISATVAITCGCLTPPVVTPPVVTHSVTLNWNPSTSTVAGYNTYRSIVNGGSYAKINTALITGLTYTDTTVLPGNTYYYVATAVTAAGVESVYSNQVAAVIPGSTLAIVTSIMDPAVVGQPYSVQLAASGGFPPYMWTLVSGSLPPGLTLSITGLISGTPTTATTSSFTIQATDSAGAAARISF